MKPKLIATIAAATALLLTGCWQKSLNPFYTDKDVYFEPDLVGTWNSPEEKEPEKHAWTFAKNDELEKVYLLKVVDGDTKMEFDARAFNLGGARYLDLFTRDRSVTHIPAHNLFRIDRLDSGLKLSTLSIDWTQKYLTAHPREIAHIRQRDPEHPNDRTKDEVILTAPTKDVQKFIAAHAKDADVFENMNELKLVMPKK